MAVSVCLMLQSALGHCMTLYPVFDMLGNGLRRKAPQRYPFWREHPLLLERLFRAFFVVITCAF